MKWRQSSKRKTVPGEYPESFVKGWMARSLPSATPAEAATAVLHLRSKGSTEQQLAEFILPYMPREVPQSAAGAQDEPPPARAKSERAHVFSVPADVTTEWLDQHLPGLDRGQLRLLVDELERRGWPSGTVAMAILPYLLPMLSDEDARAVVSGLGDLGMTDDEIARATTLPERGGRG